MSGRWTKIAAAVGLAVVLGGCNPTAAPNKSGTAAEPLRRSASHVTRGTDQMVRGATTRKGGTTTAKRTGLFGIFSSSNTRTGNRMGTGTTGTSRGTGVGTTHGTGLTGNGTTGKSTTNKLGANRMTGTGVSSGRGATGAAGSRKGNLWGNGMGGTGAGTMSATRGKGGKSGMSGSKGSLMSRGSGAGAFRFGKTGTAGTGGAAAANKTGGKSAASSTRTAAGGTTTSTTTPLHVIGFFTEGASVKGLTQLGRDPKALSYLSPWWYTLQADGSIKDKSTPATRAWIKTHNLPVMPLVTNGGQHAVLLSSSATTTAVQNLTNLVVKNNYAGINVDFQGLPSTTRSQLNAFVDDLAHQLHAHNKLVSVDIIPTQAQTGSGGAYDEVTLSHYADQIVLMTYDHHDDSSVPGPVSPHAWVLNSLQHTLKSGVPASKIVLGANDYGYDWNTTKKTAITIPQKVATTAPSSEKSYDPTTKETKVTYTKNGDKHIAYYDGLKALADKVAMAKQYKLYGIAIWKVGYENHAFWQELIKVNGDAASLQAGATNATAPSAAAGTRKKGAKPMTHRPIGTKSGTGTGGKKGSTTHSGTSRSGSGTKRGTK